MAQDQGASEDGVGSEERQWAEVVFVPSWKRNQEKKGKAFRYIAIRVRSRQLSLLGDTNDPWRHFAVVTNLAESQRGDRVLRWHRRKQGTVEYANGMIKNDLAGGVMPCARFGANAAWWRLNAIVQNLLELLKLVLPDDIALARPKTLRFRLFRFAGRLVQSARQWTLRIWSGHPLAEAIQQARETLWRWRQEVFVGT